MAALADTQFTAQQASETAPARPLSATRFFKTLASLPASFFCAQRAAGEYAALNALSDEQLAKMDLRREDIARHVIAKADDCL